MPRRCLHGVHPFPYFAVQAEKTLCLGAACTGCIIPAYLSGRVPEPLPRRCLHGVHHQRPQWPAPHRALCLGAACTGCISDTLDQLSWFELCLGAACTGCIHRDQSIGDVRSSLPRRCLHGVHLGDISLGNASKLLCLGAACTGCIQGVSDYFSSEEALPRRCLHGVHPVAAPARQ